MRLPAWPAGIAARLRAALADGATREPDADGWLLLVRPDGRRLVVAPDTVAALAAAGLLLVLPAMGEPAEADGCDPLTAAERAAIQAEPLLPPEGSSERARLDAEQARTVRGLLAAAMVRPPCFAGDAQHPPSPGSQCAACRGRRWWLPARPKTDGTGPSAHWRCAACRPAVRLQEDQIVEVVT